MSQKEIARDLGVSEAAVSTWAKQGAPVAEGAAAVAAWRATHKRVHVSATDPCPVLSADDANDEDSPADSQKDL